MCRIWLIGQIKGRKMHKFTELTRLIQDLGEYFHFLRDYSRRRILRYFYQLESFKTTLVAKLYRQRGKYVRPFLHTGMIGLALVGLMLAPLVKEAVLQESETQDRSSYLAGVSAYQSSAETQISVKPRDSVISYTVLPGDTLSVIAQKFGVSTETVLWQNDLKDDDKIQPGEIVEIPPVSGIVHKVKRGETVYSIAEKYAVDAQGIVNWPFNTFANDETFALATGQLITVPNGVKPEEKPVVPERQYVAYQTTPDAGAVVPSGTFIWPASGYISQYPVWYHMAVDIANPAAPDIVAADAGTVVLVQYLKYAYGYHVIVDHNNGYQTLYAHMSQIYVNEGQSVGKGAAIGKMGSTGRSTGTHLHFEVRRGGAMDNPLSYLK